MVYNILALFSDLTNPPAQYSIYVENRCCTDFVVVPRSPASYIDIAACSSISLKICISFVPSHLAAKMSITLQCTLMHVTVYDTDTTETA